ncbi:hypothetical protein D9758_003585 [Tetrapyrgos nigripes]|uniref:Uncharacterized protein n=1 Tax=Tetrapyrgos nigripes TaxID=182062 RepID=A0A8H5LW51_9AGAR|nr:hypothetical protein D9758_003585 [Tetrapyrgos nigripes]
MDQSTIADTPVVTPATSLSPRPPEFQLVPGQGLRVIEIVCCGVIASRATNACACMDQLTLPRHHQAKALVYARNTSEGRSHSSEQCLRRQGPCIMMARHIDYDILHPPSFIYILLSRLLPSIDEVCAQPLLCFAFTISAIDYASCVDALHLPAYLARFRFQAWSYLSLINDLAPAESHFEPNHADTGCWYP